MREHKLFNRTTSAFSKEKLFQAHVVLAMLTESFSSVFLQKESDFNPGTEGKSYIRPYSMNKQKQINAALMGI